MTSTNDRSSTRRFVALVQVAGGEDVRLCIVPADSGVTTPDSALLEARIGGSDDADETLRTLGWTRRGPWWPTAAGTIADVVPAPSPG